MSWSLLMVDQARAAQLLEALKPFTPHLTTRRRCEALARGLGWGSFATMKRELRDGRGQLVIVQPDAFARYLELSQQPSDGRALEAAIAANAQPKEAMDDDAIPF
jgi:hypothetical protein